VESGAHHRAAPRRGRVTKSGVVKDKKRCYETFSAQTVCVTPRTRGRSRVDSLRVKNCKLFTSFFFCVFMFFDFFLCTYLDLVLIFKFRFMY
jgi:hypothetical protein